MAGCVAGRAAGDVERIRNAAAEPGNWLTYSGNYSGHRHSGLTQITRDNAHASS
jgi:glucose dehydrogenase